MQTTSERRHDSATRVAFGLPIALNHEGFHEPFEAECVDLSPGGLSLRSSCLPGVGETLVCHFDAPTVGQRVEVRGEVVWAHLEGQRGGEFGVRFLDVEPTTIGLISEMLAEGRALALKLAETKAEKVVAPEADDVAKLAVDGTSDTFTARLLRRSSGLVTFEQDLSFLKLGRGVSAYQGDDVQRGEIASVAVRLDGTTPKLMVTLRYAPSDAPDDEHTRSEAVAMPQVTSSSTVKMAIPVAAQLSHDTVPDLNAPSEDNAEATGKHAVTLTEFAVSASLAQELRELNASNATDHELPRLSTRSEFDLPSALAEAEADTDAESDNLAAANAGTDIFDDEDLGPALFTANEPVATKSTREEADADEDLDEDLDEDARYEAAAARVLTQATPREALVDRVATLDVRATSGASDAHVSTVDRCDPSVMFRVDDSDEDFRPRTEPGTLTLATVRLLSLLTLVRTFVVAQWTRVQETLAPQLKARTEKLVAQLGPQAHALVTKARKHALPALRTATLRAKDTAQTLAQRFGNPSPRRRTTAIPVAPTLGVSAASTAPTVNRRSQAAVVETKRKLHVVALAATAIVGLSLAGYALFSAPDPHVVPVHREINAAAPTQAMTPPAADVALASNTVAAAVPPLSAPAIDVGPGAVTAPAVQLPAMPTALPAPSYEAGRIPAPSYPTIERAAPVVKPTAPPAAAAATVAVAAAEVAASDVVTSNAGASTMRFGASTLRGRRFTLNMSAPIKSITGSADLGGFSVVIDGALSLDRAGPIAASHSALARSMILNKGDRSELTIRFRDGLSPKYQVLARGSALEITVEE